MTDAVRTLPVPLPWRTDRPILALALLLRLSEDLHREGANLLSDVVGGRLLVEDHRP